MVKKKKAAVDTSANTSGTTTGFKLPDNVSASGLRALASITRAVDQLPSPSVPLRKISEKRDFLADQIELPELMDGLEAVILTPKDRRGLERTCTTILSTSAETNRDVKALVEETQIEELLEALERFSADTQSLSPNRPLIRPLRYHGVTPVPTALSVISTLGVIASFAFLPTSPQFIIYPAVTATDDGLETSIMSALLVNESGFEPRTDASKRLFKLQGFAARAQDLFMQSLLNSNRYLLHWLLMAPADGLKPMLFELERVQADVEDVTLARQFLAVAVNLQGKCEPAPFSQTIEPRELLPKFIRNMATQCAFMVPDSPLLSSIGTGGVFRVVLGEMFSAVKPDTISLQYAAKHPELLLLVFRRKATGELSLLSFEVDMPATRERFVNRMRARFESARTGVLDGTSNEEGGDESPPPPPETPPPPPPSYECREIGVTRRSKKVAAKAHLSGEAAAGQHPEAQLTEADLHAALSSDDFSSRGSSDDFEEDVHDLSVLAPVSVNTPEGTHLLKQLMQLVGMLEGPSAKLLIQEKSFLVLFTQTLNCPLDVCEKRIREREPDEALMEIRELVGRYVEIAAQYKIVPRDFEETLDRLG